MRHSIFYVILLGFLGQIYAMDSSALQAFYCGQYIVSRKSCKLCQQALCDYDNISNKFLNLVIKHCDEQLEKIKKNTLNSPRPCVIIDIDDTALDTWNPFGIAPIGSSHECFNLYRANKYILKLCNEYFDKKHIEIFYVTARDEDGLHSLTMNNLQSQGYPQAENLVCFPNELRVNFYKAHPGPEDYTDEYRDVIASWKLSQYKFFQRQGYKVMAMIDDQHTNLTSPELGDTAFWFMPLSYWSNANHCSCYIEGKKLDFNKDRNKFIKNLNMSYSCPIS